ncbi:MAG: maleate cis-trans isomerase family protein [Burkholderiales bacterium]
MTSSAVRVVVIVPANNTTMEPEIRSYCPGIDELVVARVPRPPRPLQVSDLPDYRKSTLDTVAPLVEGGIDLLIYGCTSAGFLAGPQGDADMVKALCDIGGAPTVSTSTAFLCALGQAGIRRVDVVSPYLDWKNESLRAFLTAGGITIERLESFNAKNPEELGRIRPEQVREKALATASPDAEALFIACSQLPTIDIIPGLSKALSRPVWSSVKAAGWQANETLKTSAGGTTVAA